MKVGILTFLVAILSITYESCRKGLSKIRALTSYEYMSENMIAHNAPILLPQRVTLPTVIYFLVSSNMSLMSNT